MKYIAFLFALLYVAPAHAVAIPPNCSSDGSHALVYSSTANAYTCVSISGGGGGGSPGGPSGALQYDNNGAFGGMTTDTAISFAAHNVIENGLSYDPRDPSYGAICGGYNIFSGNGSTTTFNYTIPFTGSGSTDNSGFMVFYEPTNGTGSATILNSGQFTVTGVNSGVGGTITLNSAPPAANTLVVVHDDAAGLIAAASAAVSSGGYVAVPDGCTIYGGQSTGTQLAEGSQLIGQGFTPNYGFQGQGVKPVMRVIAPTGAEPAFGINISGISQQFFEGFEITSNVPGANSLGFLKVPVLIGANGASGAGGGQSPGIVAQYMTFNSGKVGFGAPIGGNSAYIFAVLRFNNFTANTAGIYGPLSDFVVVGNDFESNGAFGSYGSAGGWVIGPQEGAAGSAGAGRADSNRFEFNLEGIVVQGGALITLDDNQFDGNTNCGLDLNTFWAQINIVGGWFRGNANGGVNGTGVTAAGKDAHICFNGGANSGGLHLSNVQFITNYAEGRTAPLGSTNATTPPYVLDFNGTAANNNDVKIDGGQALFGASSIGLNAAVTDFAIYRNGRPSNLSIDVDGQATQGKNANGSNPSQSRGLATNSWQGYSIVGDVTSRNNQYFPLGSGYGGIIAKNMGIGPTYYVTNDFSHNDCDIVQLDIVPNINPGVQDNAAVTWLPSANDPGYGGGFYQAHEADTNSCRMGGLTWMAVPKKYKTYAQAGCTPTGSWTNSASYTGYYGLVSNTNGDSLTCNVTTNGGPVYLWYQMQQSNGGTFTYQIDSGPLTTVATQGNNAIGAGGISLGGIRIPVGSSGAHTINVVVTSSTSGSNTVTIEGYGTPPNVPWHGSSPMVYLGGQLLAAQNGPQTNAVAAFNADQRNQANMLAADGLGVAFADIQSYVVSSDYSNPGSSAKLLASGQGHVADAFSAVMQYSPVASNSVNPLDYGASCNTQFFAGNNFYNMGANGLQTTSGSAVISINNYVFQPGTATQNGGGDVGKVISMNCGGHDIGPTTYIASVDTGANTATVGENAAITCNGTTVNTTVMLGGYPSNPNDPSTAQDDTNAIQLATAAAAIQSKGSGGGTSGGGRVSLPDRCMVHNLKPAEGVEIVGNMGGYDYSTGNNVGFNKASTKLYIGETGFNTDVDSAGNPRYIGIDVTNATKLRLRDINIQGNAFPVYGLTGSYFGMACIGATSSTALAPEAFVLDHVFVNLCPTGVGFPAGFSYAVGFTASISGNVMNVTAVSTSNFANITAQTGVNDWLAVGRTVTGSGVTANTKITSVPIGTTLGNYGVSISQTVGSEAMTSPNNQAFMSGSSRNSMFEANGIGVQADLSDWTEMGDIYTGNYVNALYMGPNIVGTGNGANRIMGGRFEENGAVDTGSNFTCDGCTSTQLTGVQFQSLSSAAYGIRFKGSTNQVTVTGGMLQGMGGSNTNAADRAQVAFDSGTATNISFDGVDFYEAHTGGGHTVNYLFESLSGSALDYISVKGGSAIQGYAISPNNWVGGTPSHYLQDVAGLPQVDTTQSTLNIGTTGLVAIGSTGAKAGLHDALGQFLVTGGTAPTISACGTSPAISGSDSSFTLNMGSGTLTSCVVNFGATWLTAPKVCDLQPTNAAAAAPGTTGAYVSAISTTQLTITGANLTSANYGVHCH